MRTRSVGPFDRSSGQQAHRAHRVPTLACVLVAALSLTTLSLTTNSAAEEPIPIAAWNDPPREARPVARWWWPGGSVDPQRLELQLRQIQQAGFGAVELQPLLLGLGPEDLAADPRLRTVGEAAFRSSVASAAAAAARIGLEFDFTLSSGWPGGLPTTKDKAERQLVMGTLDVEGPQHFTGQLPKAPDQSYRQAVEWVLDVLGPSRYRSLTRVAVARRVSLGENARRRSPILEDVRVHHRRRD